MFNTYDFIMNFNAFFRSLATNQSIKKADIRGAVLYSLKNAWKLPNHHADRIFNACFMHSSFLSSAVSAAKMVVKSEIENIVTNYSNNINLILGNIDCGSPALLTPLPTLSIFRKDVIENPIRNEFASILAAEILIQHFQLCLTLIKLLVVSAF